MLSQKQKVVARKHAWPVDVVVALGALGGLLVYFQYFTLDKFRVLRPDIRYADLDGFLTIVRQFVPLGLADRLLLILILVICVYLVDSEFRKGRLTEFFELVFRSETRTLILLGLGGLLLVRFYFAKGDFSWGADTYLHATYGWIAARSIASGELPIWTNYFCLGTPILQFYGFLFHYLVGVFNLVLGDPFLAIKAVLGVAHVVSGLTAYIFVRQLTASRASGFIAGIAYVLCFWHTQQVLILGRLPLSVFYALLPLPFYFFERIREVRGVTPATLGAFSLGALVLTHPGYGFWATVFIGLYMAVRLVASRKDGCEISIPLSVVLLAGGVSLSAFQVLPMYLERGETGLHSGFYMSDFPSPTLKHLLLWSNYRFRIPNTLDHWYGGYLGISVVFLGIWGISRAWKAIRWSEGRHGVAVVTCFLFSLVLVFCYRFLPVGVVQAMAANRYLAFVVFFISALAGIGSAALMKQKSWPSTRVFVLLLTAILLDLGPTTFQHPYRPGKIEASIDRNQMERMARDPNAWALSKPLPLQHHPVYRELRSNAAEIPVGQLPTERVFHSTNRIYYHFIIPWLAVNLGAPTPLDTFTQYPLVIPAFVRRFQDMFHLEMQKLTGPDDLAGVEAFDTLEKAAYLMNTRHLLFSRSEEDGIAHHRFGNAGPLVVAPEVSGMTYPVKELDRSRARAATRNEAQARRDRGKAIDDFKDLIERMELDIARGTAGKILLAEPGPEEDLGTHPVAEVLEHKLWNQRVEMAVNTTEECYARLAYSYYPHIMVTINGEEATALKTAGNFICLKLTAGLNRIVIEPKLSSLRANLFAIDLMLFAIGLAAIGYERLRRSR
ncbi:MAG TPA: hypothetical protein DIU35_01080 [Candidatus Latescibacteria bacterium]|nr:hypothetical protein [Gemmatimonadota bacterium]HCR16049.1 hypothetical protein [Candidatus Latescibacterota bacterium]|tara:strand:- start:1990 stop:4503 length:2514 start_codon:yes stop_codon:yes gene_type:complete